MRRKMWWQFILTRGHQLYPRISWIFIIKQWAGLTVLRAWLKRFKTVMYMLTTFGSLACTSWSSHSTRKYLEENQFIHCNKERVQLMAKWTNNKQVELTPAQDAKEKFLHHRIMAEQTAQSTEWPITEESNLLCWSNFRSGEAGRHTYQQK